MYLTKKPAGIYLISEINPAGLSVKSAAIISLQQFS